MKEPLAQFRTEEELKAAQNPRINAIKMRGYVGCIVPFICMICAAGFVFAVIKMEPPKPVLAPGQKVVSKAADEKEAEAATKKSATERRTLANLVDRTEGAGVSTMPDMVNFEVGDEVQPVTDCMGFADETDLNAFRAMLRHGDAAKARAYFEQLSIQHKSIKLPALLHMTVAASAWNGSQQVIVGTEQWWVANEWLELAADEESSAGTDSSSVDRKNKKLSEISETNRNAAEATAKEMEKMESMDVPAAEIETE